MAYSISFSHKSIKELAKISEPHYSNIKKAIYKLEDDPRPMGYIKLKKRAGYRIRVGDYRIIYDIFDKQLVIEVISVGHRRDVYD